MRDHPAHSIEVLGSGWGVRMSQLERTFIDAGFMTAVKDPIFWAPRGAYGPDQGFLKRYFFMFFAFFISRVYRLMFLKGICTRVVNRVPDPNGYPD